MRRKNFLCKMTAAVLSAAMVVTCAPVNGQTRVNAAEMEQAQGVFQFGSAGTAFSAGEYNLNVAMKKTTDITQDSMAASCLQGGTLTVKEDGSATVALNLTAASVMGQTAWASDWKIYQGADTDSDLVEAETTGTDEEGHVTQITFTLPDISKDGVYVSMSAMNTTMQAYFAFDFTGDAEKVEKKNGSAKVEQFGGYDVNVVVSVQNGKIVDIEVEGANFTGTYASANEEKLGTAAAALKEAYIGKSATDASELEGVDAVTGATYSSDAIQSAILNALGLEASEEVINLPTEKLAEGTYQVDIAFYTDGVKHSLVENDTAKATLKVDADGNMTLTTAVISGTEKEPLYFYDFNGYYEGNAADGTLKTVESIKKEDIEYSDDVFGEDEKVVTEVTFPLEGNFAAIYRTNASIYVPVMKNLTGDIDGIQFDQGRFSTDCFVKIYWDSRTKEGETGSDTGFGSQGKELGKGTYALPVSMKNATDITKNSMANACLRGAVLTVKEDGSATVTLDLTSITVTMGENSITSWASDWKIYQGSGTDGEPVDATVTKRDAENNVEQITFPIPDIQADGVYINMSTNNHANNAYLAFDYAKAVADGVYAVEGTMLKPDLKTKSMADNAFNHNVKLTVQDGKATLTLNLKGMEITSLFGYLGSMKYYDTNYEKDADNGNPEGTLKDVTVQSVQKYSDGVVISDDFGTDYPDVVSFEMIPEALEDGLVPLQVFVPIMESITEGTGNQNVYLKLDMENLAETTTEDEQFKDTDTAPENPDSGSGNPDSGLSKPDSGASKPDSGAGKLDTDKPDGTSGNSGDGTSLKGDSKTTLKVGQTAKVKGHTYKVTANGKVAFTKCKKNAKSVVIPVSVKIKGVTCKVTSIAKNAFKGNKKLTKVTVGKNVSKVGKKAFSGCKKLKTVKLKGFTKKKKAALKKLIKKAGISSKVKIK